MFKDQKPSLRSFAKVILSISFCGLNVLQGCGLESSDGMISTAVREVNKADGDSELTEENGALNSQKLEGSWVRTCIPGRTNQEERLTFQDGKFTRNYITYKNDCREKDEAYSESGRYELRAASKKVQELMYEKGNFTLKNSALQGVRDIDFSIDEWTFELNKVFPAQDRSDLYALVAECPALRVKEEATRLRIQRNGCQMGRLNTHLFDIIVQNGEQIHLGMYIRDVNSFDPALGGSAAFRNNVISHQSLTRLK